MAIDTIILVRVFHLLVDRAIEVTTTGGVSVRAWWTVGRLMIAVEDEGPWIAPKDIPGLFAETSPDYVLRQAARLTQRMDGVLTATNEGRQKGLCVILRVPVETPILN